MSDAKLVKYGTGRRRYSGQESLVPRGITNLNFNPCQHAVEPQRSTDFSLPNSSALSPYTTFVVYSFHENLQRQDVAQGLSANVAKAMLAAYDEHELSGTQPGLFVLFQ